RLADTKIIAERVDGKLTVDVSWPGGSKHNSEGCSFDIILSDDKGIEARTSNGAITLSGLSGDALARSSNGAIKLMNHDGPADVSTSNGRIELQDVAGAGTASTSNGEISITGARGSVRARSSNGAISVALSND